MPRDWFEMPAITENAAENTLKPKYPVGGNALLIYQGDKVYITSNDTAVMAELARNGEVRHLNSDEARLFEENLPFPLPLSAPGQNPTAHHNNKVGLGDVIAWFTSRLGIRECEGCKKRHRWLNKITVWGWWHP